MQVAVLKVTSFKGPIFVSKKGNLQIPKTLLRQQSTFKKVLELGSHVIHTIDYNEIKKIQQ